MHDAPSPRLGLVGCGHRGVVGFLGTLKDLGRADHVVALCDSNPARLDFAGEWLGGNRVSRYNDFAELLNDDAVETVMVATPDYTHRDLVRASFAAGKHVVCEKPMATTIEDCRAMLEARGDLEFRVAFNFRYHPVVRKVKELLLDGRIGRVCAVEAQDILGLEHGSDYFRRWHRLKDCSGGLLVHKGVHAFDAVNWWLDQTPGTVSAHAARLFYRPELQRGERCRDCAARDECDFAIDLTGDVPGQHAGIENFYDRMYLQAESHDGYIRDTCVFHKETTIPDTYIVSVRYEDGALFSYSSITYGPYEDRKFCLQGDAGRIEVSKRAGTITVFPSGPQATPEVIEAPEELGGHGGGGPPPDEIRARRRVVVRAARNAGGRLLERGYCRGCERIDRNGKRRRDSGRPRLKPRERRLAWRTYGLPPLSLKDATETRNTTSVSWRRFSRRPSRRTPMS